MNRLDARNILTYLVADLTGLITALLTGFEVALFLINILKGKTLSLMKVKKIIKFNSREINIKKFGTILLHFFLFKISNFIPPPPCLTSCLTPAGGSNPAGQLPEVS